MVTCAGCIGRCSRKRPGTIGAASYDITEGGQAVSRPEWVEDVSPRKPERDRAQVHGQINLKTFATTSPSVRSIATHTKAETKLAIWKRQNGIAKTPATRGTTARRGPENRPMKMASGPHLATKRSPRRRRSGWRD